MQAQYEMKMQAIRSKGRASRLFVNIPMPLAAALDIQAGERVRWQLLGRSELRLVRLAAPTPALTAARGKRSRKGEPHSLVLI